MALVYNFHTSAERGSRAIAVGGLGKYAGSSANGVRCGADIARAVIEEDLHVKITVMYDHSCGLGQRNKTVFISHCSTIVIYSFGLK